MDDVREQFRRLYDDNYDVIAGYALRRTESSQDAADVVSETFLVAWRRIADVPDGDRARLWLYGTARQVLANHRRGHRRRVRLVERLATLAPPAAIDTAASGDASAIARCFARLTDADRELLLLVGWEGLDAGQIAVVLGVPRPTVRVRLHRARTRFARELARDGIDTKRRQGAGHEGGGRASARLAAEEAP